MIIILVPVKAIRNRGSVETVTPESHTETQSLSETRDPGLDSGTVKGHKANTKETEIKNELGLIIRFD